MLFRRNRTPLVRGDTGGERFLRFMLLMAVFAGTGWLFWIQTSKNLEAIRNRGMVVDRTGVLTTDQRLVLKEMGKFLRDEFGQDLKIVVDVERLEPPELDNKTIFIGLCPGERQVLVDIPPLVRGLLPDDLVLDLQSSYFSPYFDNEEWPDGLLKAVKTIIDELAGTPPA